MQEKNCSTNKNPQKKEASQFDRINMTEKRLEYDRKKITPTNMTNGS